MRNDFIKWSFLMVFTFFQFTTNAQEPKFEWAKRMGGSSSDVGYSISTDKVGNVYTTGYFQGMADFDPGFGANSLVSNGGSDIFISKLDAGGKFVWVKQIGGPSSEHAYGILVDASNNVYTTGFFEGVVDFNPGPETFYLTSSGGFDIFISKLDANGNFIWAKKMGGSNYEVANSIAIDATGCVYTTGYFTETADFDPGIGVFNLTTLDSNSLNVFISKLDKNGNFLWAKSLGGSVSDHGFSIAVDRSGNVYTTGYFVGKSDFDPDTGTFELKTNNNATIFISKLDANGNFVWAKQMGGYYGVGFSLATDELGNVYTTGFFMKSVDFDPGQSEHILTSSGREDIFISKLDAKGNFVWAKNIGGTSDEQGISITVDVIGNVYATGNFAGTVDFDPGQDTFNLIAAGGTDLFISKLDAAGSFVWAKKIGGTSSDKGFSIAVDALNNVYTTGYFNNLADFDPDEGLCNLISEGEQDIFAHKMNQKPEMEENEYMLIYPNPSYDKIKIAISKPSEQLTIEVYNSTGVLLYKVEYVAVINFIDLSDLANGLYIIKLLSVNKSLAAKKIVKL